MTATGEPAPAEEVGRAQVEAWNGRSGRAWVDAQDLLDGMFAPIVPLLAEAAGGAARVLDVGCGTGAVTLALAAAATAGRTATGVDISAPMLALARRRAAAVGLDARFVEADAASHAFGTGAFDAIVSRFGVMFFAEPVAAFANLRRAAAGGGRLCAIAWRGAAENPFMTTAERAAGSLIPAIPPRVPGAPGQFAFADPERVREILDAAGWREVRFLPLDVACTFPAVTLLDYVTRLGPVGAALQDADDALRQRVVPVLREAFASFVDGDAVRFTAACWRIEARAA